MGQQYRSLWIWIVCGLLLTLDLAGCSSSGGGDGGSGQEIVPEPIEEPPEMSVPNSAPLPVALPIEIFENTF